MRDLKYIIVCVGIYEVGILFNGLLSHSQMVPEKTKLISAGFCTIKPSRIATFVEIHLEKAGGVDVSPRQIDKIILEQTLDKQLA